MAHAPTQHDLIIARTVLRGVQRDWAAKAGLSTASAGTAAQALTHWQDRIDKSHIVDDKVYSGPFAYDLAMEKRRWDRTRAVIDRAQPGPDEDGSYLEFLARQAATVELIAAHPALGFAADVYEAFDGILFGTTGEPKSSASTKSLPGSSAAVIELSAGMVYLMYQSAKSVVTAWKLIESDGHPGFSATPEDVAATLDADPAPLRQLVATLVAWFVEGQPRPAHSEAPPAIYHAPLTMLINNAERFVIAHEYCHALFDQLGLPALPWLPPVTDAAITKELRADYFAATVVALSAMEIDRMAPNMALQGAVLALKVHEIADEAIHAVVHTPMAANSTHPPFADRIKTVFAAYHDRFDTQGNPDLGDDPVQQASDTVAQLWTRGGPEMLAGMQQRPLHPIWT